MTKRVHLICLLILVCLVPSLFSCGGGGTGGSGSADTVTLQWNPPTTNANGTPLLDLEGYRVYYGQKSGTYTYIIDVKDSDTVVIGGLSSGHWCFVATAYDTSGNESDYSNEVCTDIY